MASVKKTNGRRSRVELGDELFDNGEVRFLGTNTNGAGEPVPAFEVIGKSYDSYIVELDDGEWFCECPDHTYRRRRCKHIRAAQRKWEEMKGAVSLDTFGFVAPSKVEI